jgi:hypothetical protein
MKTRVGRGASRKWATAEGEPPREYELDSGVFSGVWRRDVLLEVGGWDERWPRNQDSEMAGRFLARGETLICLSDMASRYTPRGTLGGLWRQYLQYGEYREKTAVRHPHTLRRSHVLLPSLVLATVAAAIAPRPMRTIARAGLGSYVALLGATGILSARDAESATDAALVPVVIAITHFGHGTGFLLGVARNGPPTAALRRLAGATGAELSSSSETVYAPSLTGSTDQSLAVPA